MNRDFKLALMPYLFDGGFLVTYMLPNIPNWPQVNVSLDEDEDEFMEPLDTENCEFVDFTENTVTISCGGDWQPPKTLVVGFKDGNLQVINIISDEFADGIDYDMFEALFWDLIDFMPKTVKSIIQLKYELEIAINDEDYILAAKLRDELNERNK